MHHDCEDQEQIYSMSHGAAFDTFGPTVSIDSVIGFNQYRLEF